MSVRWLKKLNLLNILALKFCSKYICLLAFFYLKLFICPSDVKRPKSFMSFTTWTPIKVLLWMRCGACSTLRHSHAFYNIQKLHLSLKKTDINRTAWINPCFSHNIPHVLIQFWSSLISKCKVAPINKKLLDSTKN